jgi:hypothetical protein
MINLCYVSNNMINKTHSEICLLTISDKCILYIPIGYYLCGFDRKLQIKATLNF